MMHVELFLRYRLSDCREDEDIELINILRNPPFHQQMN
jgi:hypothetical protein